MRAFESVDANSADVVAGFAVACRPPPAEAETATHNAATPTNAALNVSLLIAFLLALGVAVRVEDANGRDRIDGKGVPRSALPNRLGTRRLVHAERLPAVLAHVRVEPCDLVAVPFDDPAAGVAVVGVDVPDLAEAAL